MRLEGVLDGAAGPACRSCEDLTSSFACVNAYECQHGELALNLVWEKVINRVSICVHCCVHVRQLVRFSFVLVSPMQILLCACISNAEPADSSLCLHSE